MKTIHYDDLIDQLITDHSDISLMIKHFMHRAESEDIRSLAGEAILYYDRVIRAYSHKEESDLVELSKREKEPLDVEGLRLSRMALEESRKELMDILEDPAADAAAVKDALLRFLQTNLDRFLAEENQYFVKDLDEIYVRAGSY